MYIRHIIGQDGGKVDMEKIKSIIEWSRPKNLIELRGFIEIRTYYRKFVKGFSQLTSPLTDLTKKYAFQWHEGAEKYFQRMKEVIRNCPILDLPYFSKPFFLECDALEEGIGAVLKQGKHPIDFESRNLKPHKNIYSIYDKEILSIMHALINFRQYLVGKKFVVKTDHNGLRYYLTQKDLNERKKKWVIKIQEFDSDIGYAKGKNNVVDDSLSR